MPIDERQERIKALDVAVGQIEKQFGAAPSRLGQRNTISLVEAISTGAISIDYALGIGACRGRVVEIAGPDPRARRPWRCRRLLSPEGRRLAFVDLSTRSTPEQKLGVDDKPAGLAARQRQQALEIAGVLNATRWTSSSSVWQR